MISLKIKRRLDAMGVDANTTREKARKVIDRLVLKYWGDKVEIVADGTGKRTYFIDNCIVLQFNTSDDVRKKKVKIDKLLERMRDGREEIRC